MKITVTHNDGSTMYESDSQSMKGIAPALDERERVALALHTAAKDLAAGRLPPLAGDGPIG
jgi:hypothetical protein